MSKAETAAAENRLAGELSPYLLQHKDNPVDWYPWGEAAFAAARADNKPILLSVGYAACHWCHVMAHESFEDPAIAARMNQLFVNIKVDREERPDLDTIYQSALALLGQQGGWPLTMFLTPKGEPFWGGTYFPPEPRYGRPGLPQVLDSVAEVYAQDPKRIGSNVEALKEALGKLSSNAAGARPTLVEVEAAAERLVREIDPFDGGFGTAPKFPQSPALKLLWRAWKRGGKAPYKQAVLLTLTRICQGGIYDHLGGGFARYTVDRHWLVPHFEKMLYDNAQLLELLAWAWQETGDPLFEERARETVDWLHREMLAEGGAFAASLDADSEGEEGRFYVWDEAEIDQALGAEATLFKQHYDVTAGGNFERRNILNRLLRPERASAEVEARLKRAREKLLERRAARVRPGWDDKVLADWNGLMIAALARAAPAFEATEWLAAAERAFAFVIERMSGAGDALLHAWRRGEARHRATLDDYAFMSEAALALYEATGRGDYLEHAEGWVAYLDRQFWDQATGGYFFTDRAAEDLLLRSKTAFDSATPSGNGALVAVLARLHYLTGKAHYRERAEALLTAFSGDLERAVLPLATLLAGCELLDRALEIVILGRRGEAATEDLLRQVHARSLPNAVLTVAEDSSKLPAGHPAKGRERKDGKATAYLCRAQSCSLPIAAPEALGAALDE